MKNQPSIELVSVSKKFRRDMQSFYDLAGFVFGIPSARDFWAIDGIELTLHPGEVLGVIGKNGAGKSTLLKLIARITRPTKGKVKVRGRIGPLIELGAGFNPELTGGENVYLYGAILGMTHNEIVSEFNTIIAFAELENWINTPVKFYSSGMLMRLAFSITVFSKPDIVLIDEALSIGDIGFQSKCLGKIEELRKQNKAVVLVGHDTSQIKAHSTKCLWLEKGKQKMIGLPEEVTRAYLAGKDNSGEEVVNLEQHSTLPHLPLVQKIQIVDKDGALVRNPSIGQKFGFKITYIWKDAPRGVKLGCNIYTSTGTHVLSSHAPNEIKQSSTTYSTLWIPAHFLNAGRYTIRFAFFTPTPFTHFLDTEDFDFTILDKLEERIEKDYTGSLPGIIHTHLTWTN